MTADVEANASPIDQQTKPAEPDKPQPKKRPRRSPYPHLFRLLHWVLPVAMIASVVTGLSLHAVAAPDWSVFSGVLPGWLLSGRMHLFHLISATVIVPSMLAALWLYMRRKVRRRVTHVTLLGGGLVMIAAGLLMLFPTGPPEVYWVARLLHTVTGLLVLPVALLWHAAHGVGRFRRVLVPIFHPWASPRWGQVAMFLPLLGVSAAVILGMVSEYVVGNTLMAGRIEPVDLTTDQLRSLDAWDQAEPLSIELAGGIGFDKGRTRVTLTALHDGHELFVRAEWDDTTESRMYMPWKKTADGWEQLVTDHEDESVHYEDKFSLVFPTVQSQQFDRFGCAMVCHAGGGRAYGYKGSDDLIDVWHWKATRTDPVGQVDDKYWSAADFDAKDVGRHGDPKPKPGGGGYSKNFKPGDTHPAKLPKSPAAVKQGIIFADQAVQYNEADASRIAPGTIVPGIIASAALGDRGDVSCMSYHENDRWTLIMRRKLDTESPKDTAFAPGQTYSFGCAAFDHTSKRHAYGLSAYRLSLQE